MTLYRIIIKKGNRTLHTSVVGFRERKNLCKYRDRLLTEMTVLYGNGVTYSILELPQSPKATWHKTEWGEIIYNKNAKFSTR